MNRHQRAPATRREAPLDACVALGRKAPLASRGPKALSFTAKQLVLLHRAASLKHREFANCSAPSLARPLGKKNAALRLRALANTQKPHSLKKLQRGNAPPPRAPRTHHPRAAAMPRRRRRATPTPQHPNFTASASTADSHRETRRPSSTRSRATTSTIRR